MNFHYFGKSENLLKNESRYLAKLLPILIDHHFICLGSTSKVHCRTERKTIRTYILGEGM